eukprot:1260922-Pyramimonas_sp.AAC.1
MWARRDFLLDYPLRFAENPSSYPRSFDARDRGLLFSTHLDESPAGGELADAVPADGIGPAKGEGVVGGEVADDVARLGVQHQHRRGRLAVPPGLLEHEEAGHGRHRAVVKRVPGQQPEALVHCEDVARTHGGAVAEVCVVAGQVRLRRENPKRRSAARRRSRPVLSSLGPT